MVKGNARSTTQLKTVDTETQSARHSNPRMASKYGTSKQHSVIQRDICLKLVGNNKQTKHKETGAQIKYDINAMSQGPGNKTMSTAKTRAPRTSRNQQCHENLGSNKRDNTQAITKQLPTQKRGVGIQNQNGRFKQKKWRSETEWGAYQNQVHGRQTYKKQITKIDTEARKQTIRYYSRK